MAIHQTSRSDSDTSSKMSLKRSLRVVVLFSPFLLFACATEPRKDAAQDPFLRPYVEQLKKDASKEDLRKIASMAKSELILLLHGYGTGIRNRWIHGNRDPELTRFFRAKGIRDPEAASWQSLRPFGPTSTAT